MEEIKYTLMPNETNTYVNTNDSKTYVINSDCDEVLVESNNENIRIEQSGKVFKVIGVTQGTSEITVTLSKTITIESENKPPVEKPEAPEEIVPPPPPPPVEEPLPEIPEEADLTDDQLRAAGLNRKTYAYFYKKMYDILESEPSIQTRDKNMIPGNTNQRIKQLVLDVPNETRTPLINKLHDSQDQTMIDALEALTLNNMYNENESTKQYEFKTREEATKDYLFKNPKDKYEAYINLAFQQPKNSSVKDHSQGNISKTPEMLTYLDMVKHIPELKKLLKNTDNATILARAKKASYNQPSHESMTEEENIFNIYFYVSMQIYALEMQLNAMSSMDSIPAETKQIQIDQIKFNIQILKDKLCYDMKLEPNAAMSQAYITGYADIEKYLNAKKWKFDASVVGTMAAEVELTEEDYTKAGQELTVLSQMVQSHCPVFKSMSFEMFDKYVNNYDELTDMTKINEGIGVVGGLKYHIQKMQEAFDIPPYKNKLDILVKHGFKKVVEFKGTEHTNIELEAKSAKKFYDTRKLIENTPLETLHLVTDSIDPIFRNLFKKKDVEVARDYIAIAISELYNSGWSTNNISNAERVETEVFRILGINNA